jgi:hypothetical protein
MVDQLQFPNGLHQTDGYKLQTKKGWGAIIYISYH